MNDLLDTIESLKESSIIAVTSKVVSICEGRCIEIGKIDKNELIKKEADKYLPRENSPFSRSHTIKNGILIGGAGIDESNANGYYILWPKDPDATAKKIWEYLRNKFKIKNLGVIVTDSNARPLRRGIVGLALGLYGFEPLKDYRGKPDIFGKSLKFSQTNLADSLAATAVMVMGEGNEQTPIAIFEDLSFVKFTSSQPKQRKKYSTLKVPFEEDLFYPFLSAVKWIDGKRGN